MKTRNKNTVKYISESTSNNEAVLPLPKAAPKVKRMGKKLIILKKEDLIFGKFEK